MAYIYQGRNFGNNDWWADYGNWIYNYLEYTNITRDGNEVTVHGLKYWFTTKNPSWTYGTYNFPVTVNINGGQRSETLSFNSSNFTTSPTLNIGDLTFNAGSASTTSMSVYLSNENGSANDAVISFPAGYTAPAVPTATNLVSNGTPSTAYSKVTSNGWGNASSKRRFEIICNNSTKTSSTADNPSMYWTLPNGSNNTNAGVVISWTGRAVNDHDLWTDSATKYITTPSAPILSFTGDSGTGAKINISAVIKYKGGTTNSITSNNGAIANHQVGLLLSTQSGVPTTLATTTSTDTTFSEAITKDQMTSGNNYKIYVRATNNYGGSSSTTSGIFYCPTAVHTILTNRTTSSVTFRCEANDAGTYGSASGGTLACYQLKWSTDQATVDAGGGTATEIQASDTFTITGLNPGQTVYWRVTAWNSYGLSNTSNTLSVTTIPRYDPALSDISWTVGNPGISATITIGQTGGLSPDELVVSSIKAEKKPASSSTWTTITEVTGLSLIANDTYTLSNLLTGVQDTEGDYQIRLTISNGTDQDIETYTISAPSVVTLNSLVLASSELIQVQGTMSRTDTVLPCQWELYNQTDDETYSLTSSSTNPTILSHKHLLFNTTYTMKAKCVNKNGLWRWSATKNVTTSPRFQWYYSGEAAKKCDATIKLGNAERTISEVYLVVKDALGNVGSGASLKGKQLQFITQPLHYRPENVASITLSNGKSIKYGLYQDQYVFGIWSGDTPQTVFFDDTNGWAMTSYNFGNNTLTVTGVTHSGKGLNSSAPFSTTTLHTPADWETN